MLHGTGAQHAAWHGCAAIPKLAPAVRVARVRKGHERVRTHGCTWSEAKHGAGTADVGPEQ
eukprot:15026774-Alexandrium_andersonii.AAC.1